MRTSSTIREDKFIGYTKCFSCNNELISMLVLLQLNFLQDKKTPKNWNAKNTFIFPEIFQALISMPSALGKHKAIIQGVWLKHLKRNEILYLSLYETLKCLYILTCQNNDATPSRKFFLKTFVNQFFTKQKNPILLYRNGFPFKPQDLSSDKEKALSPEEQQIREELVLKNTLRFSFDNLLLELSVYLNSYIPNILEDAVVYNKETFENKYNLLVQNSSVLQTISLIVKEDLEGFAKLADEKRLAKSAKNIVVNPLETISEVIPVTSSTVAPIENLKNTLNENNNHG